MQKYEGLRSLFEQKDPCKFIKAGMTTSAKDTFTAAFSTPISKISELKGSGYPCSGDYIWIRFKSLGAVALREQFGLSQIQPAEAVKTFLSICPQNRVALSETANLECVRGMRKNFGSEQLLLSNKKRQIYWFQTWH